MTGRTPAIAVESFLHPIRRAVSCVTRAVPDVAGGYFPSTAPHSLMLNQGVPVRLSGSSNLHFTMVVNYTIAATSQQVSQWSVEVNRYAYILLDNDLREILAFHWHPGGLSPVRHPHLHIGAGAQAGFAPLQKAHVPTGHVTLQDVLLFAITDLDVEPLIDRDLAVRMLSGNAQA